MDRHDQEEMLSQVSKTFASDLIEILFYSLKTGAVRPINGGNAPNRTNAGPISNTNRPNAAGTIPVNGVTRPTNNANTNRPSNGNQGETNNNYLFIIIIFFRFLGTVNIPLQQIIGSANQRVKKPASTTRRIVTTIKRQSATVRPTTRKN